MVVHVTTCMHAESCRVTTHANSDENSQSVLIHGTDPCKLQTRSSHVTLSLAPQGERKSMRKKPSVDHKRVQDGRKYSYILSSKTRPSKKTPLNTAPLHVSMCRTDRQAAPLSREPNHWLNRSACGVFTSHRDPLWCLLVFLHPVIKLFFCHAPSGAFGSFLLQESLQVPELFHHSHVQGCHAVISLGVDLRAVFEEEQHQVFVCPQNGFVEGRVTRHLRSGVHLCPCLHEKFCDRLGIGHRSRMEGGVSGLSRHIGPRPLPKEVLDKLQVSPLASQVQDILAVIVIDSVVVRNLLDKFLQSFQFPVSCRLEHFVLGGFLDCLLCVRLFVPLRVPIDDHLLILVLTLLLSSDWDFDFLLHLLALFLFQRLSFLLPWRFFLLLLDYRVSILIFS
mmetsp:Transcript_55277/g.108143  ORF Transcript_55277/g.108143 Transcript_55277/m.108143 type:complete len:393 (+) Transcript_55277:346-1524(+)